MKRILICSTIIATVKAFLVPHIDMLKQMGYVVDVAGQMDSCDINGIADHVYNIQFERNPFSRQNLKAAKQLKSIVRQNQYDIIHFHTPVAGAFGRYTIKELRNQGTRILYTAHGFHFYKGAPLLNWLIYYPVEKYLSKYTHTLITINNEDYERATKKFKKTEVVYVPGVGLDVDKFKNTVIDRVQKRCELGVPENATVLLSVGELNKNKNHIIGIRAMALCKNENLYYLVCGQGPLKDPLKKEAVKLGVGDRVFFLGSRNDIPEILKASDIFIFPSLREGLPVSLMEAMASGLPCIASNIRGNRDLSPRYVINKNSVEEYTDIINRITLNIKKANKEIADINYSKIQNFSLSIIKRDLLNIYKNR